MDGFRALAHIEQNQCRLISRNGHIFKSWPQLGGEIADAIRTRSAIVDGEIVCLDGRSNFRNLLFRRQLPFFYVFDILACDKRESCRILSASGVCGATATMAKAVMLTLGTTGLIGSLTGPPDSYSVRERK